MYATTSINDHEEMNHPFHLESAPFSPPLWHQATLSSRNLQCPERPPYAANRKRRLLLGSASFRMWLERGGLCHGIPAAAAALLAFALPSGAAVYSTARLPASTSLCCFLPPKLVAGYLVIPGTLTFILVLRPGLTSGLKLELLCLQLQPLNLTQSFRCPHV